MRETHVFLGERHEAAERNMWATIALTVAMMVLEIVGGAWFGSVALIADGFHMSTHAGALLIAALAYTLARRRAHDERFTFGTGKFGDLAGFSSALVLGMIAIEIAYEAAARLFAPGPIAFAEAIPIAILGLFVNLASAWLLSRGGHHHHHGHEHGGHDHDESRTVDVGGGSYQLSIFERDAPPRFRLVGPVGSRPAFVETVRPDGKRQRFAMSERGGFFESDDAIPEPHAFEAAVVVGAERGAAHFVEHAHGIGEDNNMRAAIAHVIADAAVSVLVIAGLVLAKLFGWLFLDPLAALAGAAVIASWSWQLIRATGRVLLDMNPDPALSRRIASAVEAEGDALGDLHLWRIGPGHLGAIVSVETTHEVDCTHYRRKIGALGSFSHLTVEVVRFAREARRGAA